MVEFGLDLMHTRQALYPHSYTPVLEPVFPGSLSPPDEEPNLDVHRVHPHSSGEQQLTLLPLPLHLLAAKARASYPPPQNGTGRLGLLPFLQTLSLRFLEPQIWFGLSEADSSFVWRSGSPRLLWQGHGGDLNHIWIKPHFSQSLDSTSRCEPHTSESKRH